MSWCNKCGQCGEADGGIGCQCGKCRCGLTADESGYCFLCRPCKMHNQSMSMHTSGMMQDCAAERPAVGKLQWKIKKENQ